MAPKSKKAIDEPPANSTRAKTGTDDAGPTSSRKRAADFFDGEIGENADKVVPRAKVQKEKTAKQSAEVEAESKPHHTDEALDAVKRAGGGGPSVAAEPATHAKQKKSKAPKGEAAKADKPAVSTRTAKGKKAKAPKDTAAESTAMDDLVVDGEALGGDDGTMRAQTGRAGRKKGKTAKGEAAEETTEEPAKPKAKRGRPKNSEAKEDAPSAQEKQVETEKTHPGGDRVEVEPAKPTKGPKGKKTAEKPAGDSSTAKGKSKGSKKAGEQEDSVAPEYDATKPSAAEPAKSTKKATKAGEAKPAKQSTTGKDKSSSGKSGMAEQGASSEPQTKGEKAKAAPANTTDITDSADIDPDMAMDDSVFDSLLAKDKGKAPVNDDPASSEKPKSKKASKKTSKEQKPNDTIAKAKAKPEKKTKDAPKRTDGADASTTKSKKRKTPAGHDADVVKTDVLDPLAESASAKKKQKKAQPGALEAVGSLLGSTVDSAKKKAKAVIDYAGDITGSAQKSITDDVVDVAEGAVQEKKKKSKQSKAQEPGSTNGSDPVDDDDDGTFFGDTSYLKGFESSSDESDGADIDFPTDPQKSVPKLPKDAQSKAKAVTASTTTSSGPGYIYVGRIPHGFYEHQMRAYFTQFGHITNLRLSRNKTTGHSKHFGFLEFENEEVAKIVASTMDNYLLFGHILKVKLIPKEQLHPDTFKGANKRFTTVPWAQIKGRELSMPVSREHWEKRVSKEAEKRQTKAQNMKEIGYDFEAPLKGVETVPVKKGKGKKAIEEGIVVEEEETLITGENEDGSMVVTEVVRTKKTKGKGKEVLVSEAGTVVKKGKRKAEEGVEMGKGKVADAVEPAAKKAKKGKDKAVESAKKVEKSE